VYMLHYSIKPWQVVWRTFRAFHAEPPSWIRSSSIFSDYHDLVQWRMSRSSNSRGWISGMLS